VRTRTWLGMMSGLCLASVVARADAPLPVVAAPEALPTGDLQVDASDASGAAVWEAMQKGAMSPEEAWKQGLLDAQAVQAGLNTGLAGGEDDVSKRLRVSLGGLLVRHAPEVTKDALKRPKSVQLALADFYTSQGDEKAAPLYEAVLKQTPAPYGQGLVMCALGEFWAGRKQPQKAQDVFERGRQVLTGSYPHFAGEMLIRAARTWAECGNQEKASLLYARVAKEGDGWMTGMALWDQGTALLSKGDYQQARVLLQRPVTGEKADQIKVALTSSLAFSYYTTGDFAEARRLCTDTSNQFKALKKPLEGLSGQACNAPAMLMWMDRWKDDPNAVFCEPLSQITLIPDAPPKQPISRQLALRSYRPAQVSVSTDTKGVEVQALNNGQAQKRAFFYENLFDVRLDPHLFADVTQDTDVMLTLHVSQPKPIDLQVPLHIHVKSEDDCPTCGANTSG